MNMSGERPIEFVVPMDVSPLRTHKIDPTVGSKCVGIGILSTDEPPESAELITADNGLFLLFSNVASLNVLDGFAKECQDHLIDALDSAPQECDQVYAEAAGEFLRSGRVELFFGRGMLQISTIDTNVCGRVGIGIIVTDQELPVGSSDLTANYDDYPVVYLVFCSLGSVLKFRRLLAKCRSELKSSGAHIATIATQCVHLRQHPISWWISTHHAWKSHVCTMPPTIN
jgi:hypothetical protein